MPRIAPLDPAQATGKAKTLLDGVKASIGAQPNIFRTLAHSPAALESYLNLSQGLAGGNFSAALREQIALAVAGENNCDYCASAHTFVGRKNGLSDNELAANLTGKSNDSRTEAILTFAKAIVEKRGFVSNAEVKSVRDAGLNDGEIIELIAVVSANIFTNYFNHVVQTEIDFPVVSAGEETARQAA